jgi:hypothetical protein
MEAAGKERQFSEATLKSYFNRIENYKNDQDIEISNLNIPEVLERADRKLPNNDKSNDDQTIIINRLREPLRRFSLLVPKEQFQSEPSVFDYSTVDF